MEDLKKILYLLPLEGVVHGSSVVANNFERYIISPRDKVISTQLSDHQEIMGKYSFRKLLKILKILWEVFRVRNQVDKYVLFYTSSKPLIYRDLLIKILLYNKEAILMMHNKGMVELKIPKFFKTFFFKESKLVLLSEKLYGDVEDYINFNQIEVIPNCFFSEEVPRFKRKNYDQLNFLFLSNLIDSKGVKESIEIVNRLISNNLNVTLDIVGKEIDYSSQDLDDIIGLNYSRIRYHGALYGVEKTNILEACNVLIFPTRYKMECFPLVILESFANGIPVISSFNGAISDIVKHDHNGLLFEDFTTEDSIQKISEIIQSISKLKWEELSKAAHETVLKDYTLNDWIKKTKKVIQ